MTIILFSVHIYYSKFTSNCFFHYYLSRKKKNITTQNVDNILNCSTIIWTLIAF